MQFVKIRGFLSDCPSFSLSFYPSRSFSLSLSPSFYPSRSFSPYLSFFFSQSLSVSLTQFLYLTFSKSLRFSFPPSLAALYHLPPPPLLLLLFRIVRHVLPPSVNFIRDRKHNKNLKEKLRKANVMREKILTKAMTTMMMR